MEDNLEWPSNRPLSFSELKSAIFDVCIAHRIIKKVQDQLLGFLEHPLSQTILHLSGTQLESLLMNDAYKPKMHKVYATDCACVTLEFQLQLRHTPISLLQIRDSMPMLWQQFLEMCHRRLAVQPYPPQVVATLEKHFAGFDIGQAALQRAAEHGVAYNLQWVQLHDQLIAYAKGPAEAASHVETTLTQAIQELIILAQVEALRQETGVELSQEVLLASSLVKLAAGVDQLNTQAHPADGHDVHMTLFSGRRASSRRYLLLQNWYCMLYLQGYTGSSSVFVAAFIDQCSASEALKGIPGTEPAISFPLQGTLAHEVVSSIEQLLAEQYDVMKSGSRAQITALLAHMLMLRETGGLATATALADTFGTPGFVRTALAADVPEEFKNDLQERYVEQWEVVKPELGAPGAKMFDVFRIWRLDSGRYTDIARYMRAEYDRRNQELNNVLPPLTIMHSNLSSYDEIISCSHLPTSNRPTFFAFGTLADGFLPFEVFPRSNNSRNDAIGKREVDIELCSVVMKAVQAHHPGLPSVAASAGKLGDNASGKLTVDLRLDAEAQKQTEERLTALAVAGDERIDPELVSKALAAAYHAVTRDGILR